MVALSHGMARRVTEWETPATVAPDPYEQEAQESNVRVTTAERRSISKTTIAKCLDELTIAAHQEECVAMDFVGEIDLELGVSAIGLNFDSLDDFRIPHTIGDLCFDVVVLDFPVAVEIDTLKAQPERTPKVGRPTVMTQTTIARLEMAWRLGCADREAADFAEISPQTIWSCPY